MLTFVTEAFGVRGKAGDLERDYNYFSILPEFFSQGNGNFRDVNQNRRCDAFFAPCVGRENVKEFYRLIQSDGYNSLGVEKLTYRQDREKPSSYPQWQISFSPAVIPCFFRISR
mgnify:CR=1 FL=1